MSPRFPRRVLYLLILLALLAGPVVPFAPVAEAQETVPVTITIVRFQETQNPDPGIFQFCGDYYSRVAIAGFPSERSDTISGNPDLFGGIICPVDLTPNWVFSKEVNLSQEIITATISIIDEDGFGSEPDDVIDLNPLDGVVTLTLTINLITGVWTGDWTMQRNPTSVQGDGDREHFDSDEGGEHGRVFFDVSIGADSDGDGLLDRWEINGFDADGDGIVDVDLPGMGANPLQKDLFLELDYTIGRTHTRAGIRAVKRAFAAAPLANPDGTTGVNLFVDTGNLVDPSAREGQPEGTCLDGIDNGGDGQTDGADVNCVGIDRFLETSTEDPLPGNCNDGIDNNTDGRIDANDPTCLVGDNLGGGNALPALNNCGLDAAFYTAKGANFNPNRAAIFRYAISTSQGAGCPGGAIGGQGEIGGNDFIDYNQDGGTIIHELGHNLTLGHGGNEDNNCKPNYVSTMNYDSAFGILRAGGGMILDYSPPRINLNGATRGNAPLANLVESSLNETVALDAGDVSNRFVFSNINLGTGTVQKVQTTLTVLPDWNGDGDTIDTGVQMNIDDAAGLLGPAACENDSSDDTLEGFHDWNQISIPFRQFGNSADGPIHPEPDAPPTREELIQMLAALNTTDLSVEVSDSEEPVAAGTPLTYTLTVVNHGLNPATSVQVTNTLPADVSFASSSVPCLTAANVVDCNLGELLAGATRSFTITVDVPADLVYTNGGPKTITNNTSVQNLAGPDTNSANNGDAEDTTVIARADAQITGITPASPLEVLIGQPTTATIDITVANGGPSSPVDTILTGTASADPGASVTPSSTSEGQTAVAVGAPQTVSQTFTLACTTPGFKTIAFDYTIALKNAPVDIDPVPTNNDMSASFQIDCVVPIAINVRPKGFPNAINLNTDATIAALTTEAGEYGLPLAFDATTIDPLSVRWGLRANLFNVGTAMGAQEIHDDGHLERSYELDEKTRDDDLDMVLHFKPADSGLTVDTSEACLKGSFLASDGNTYRFLGCDAVVVRP